MCKQMQNHIGFLEMRDIRCRMVKKREKNTFFFFDLGRELNKKQDKCKYDSNSVVQQ